MAMHSKDHWTAEANANYRDDPLSGWVIRYNPTPGGKKNEDGSLTHTMTFPALALTGWVSDPEQAARDIAKALNASERQTASETQ
ncbi:hypothetical protein [Roseibium sp.]|uniref:hypothetical protein n=1 Tax=Roseibium sp. TaxID=1936156 RepID=UPI0032799995